MNAFRRYSPRTPRSLRVAADLPAGLRLSSGVELEGRLVDLGLAGACVRTREAFRPDELRALRVPTGDRELILRARVRWQHHGDAGVMSGVSFAYFGPRDRERLWLLASTACLEFARVLCPVGPGALTFEAAVGLAQVGRFRDYSAGDALYGPPPDLEPQSLFVSWSGHLLIEWSGVGLAGWRSLGPGHVVGAVPVVSGGRQVERVQAHGDCRVVEVSRRSFGFIQASKPWLADQLERWLLGAQLERLQELATARGRGAAYPT